MIPRKLLFRFCTVTPLRKPVTRSKFFCWARRFHCCVIPSLRRWCPLDGHPLPRLCPKRSRLRSRFTFELPARRPVGSATQICNPKTQISPLRRLWCRWWNGRIRFFVNSDLDDFASPTAHRTLRRKSECALPEFNKGEEF